MPMTQADHLPGPIPAVQTVLGALRRRIRQYVWWEGIALAMAWLGAAFWFTLAVDWFFEPPAAVRIAMQGIVAAVFLGIVWQRIVQRAFVRMTDVNMATVLERRFRQFDDSLLTAVTLGNRTGDDSEWNEEMYSETCRAATAHLGDVRLKEVFNPRPLWRAGMAAVLLLLSVAIFAVVFPESIATWARRTLGLSNELWTRNTRLIVDGFEEGMRKVARGSDLEVIALADMSKPLVPQLVEVRYRTDGGARGRATMDRRGVARPGVDPYQAYAYTFRGLLADVHFEVVGGDDRVRDQWIEVVDSPKISEMSLECELPSYIGRSQPQLPVTGVMQIPMGAKITVHAGANKSLADVQVDMMIEDQAGPREETPQVEISDDGRTFQCRLHPVMKDTTLLFTLTDTDKIKSRDAVRLALTPIADQPPQIVVQLDGIGTAVTPQARVPVVGRVTDDYGVDRIWFEHAVDAQTPAVQPITLPAEYPIEVKLADAAVEVGKLGATPGQKMLVCVKAADRCDLGKGVNVGAGERWLLDVVTPEQLRAMLESRELVLRQRFDRIVQEMTETRDLLARLDFSPRADAKNAENAETSKDEKAGGADEEPDEESAAESADESPKHQSGLRLLRVQGALTNSRKSTQEVVGVAEAIDDIRKQLINNRIDTEELKNRLQSGICDPLRVIVEQMFPELERRLEKLLAGLSDDEAAPALRDEAQRQADEIIVAMRKVLDRMIALEDFNEAVELLRGIIKAQEELRSETQQLHKQKIRDLLKE